VRQHGHDDFVDAADELYAEPPDGFVTARAAAAEAARQEGDAARAKEIAALRKPTVGAWLVNRLALKRADLVAGLVELAGSLRTAQRELRGEKLRELARQRRELVASLVDEARRLAIEADAALANKQLPLTEVESTLNAALADREVAQQVQTGRLLKTTAYEGFGELPEPSESSTEDRPSRGELKAAQKAAAEAEWEAQRASDAVEEAQATLDGVDAELEKLRRQRKAAADELSERRKEHTAAERALAQAKRRVTELER
jgi:hypothetical protein